MNEHFKKTERLSNLVLLKNDMIDKDICIYMYNFTYNDVHCTIIVDIAKKEHIILTFVSENKYEVIARYSNNYLDFKLFNFINMFHCNFPKKNENDYIYDMKKKDFFNKIYVSLNEQTPTAININNNNRYLIARVLAKRDKNEGHIYCYSMVANGRDGKRTPYNSSLTKLLKPELFEKYRNDINISFKYSSNPNDEKEWFEIIKDYNGKRKN